VANPREVEDEDDSRTRTIKRETVYDTLRIREIGGVSPRRISGRSVKFRIWDQWCRRVAGNRSASLRWKGSRAAAGRLSPGVADSWRRLVDSRSSSSMRVTWRWLMQLNEGLLHRQAGDLREVRIRRNDCGINDERTTSNYEVGQGQDGSASVQFPSQVRHLPPDACIGSFCAALAHGSDQDAIFIYPRGSGPRGIWNVVRGLASPTTRRFITR
jgi:hypothetical protein